MTENKRPFRILPLQIKKWLNILSISRLLRWFILFGIGYWLYTNWHENLPGSQLMERYAFPDSQFIPVDGMDVHCRITGKGDPILLLHDAQSSLHTWTRWTDSLSRNNRVISVDLPGFGLTGPHPRGSYSAFMYVSFLDSLVQKLALKKFHLVGNGLGAQIAWQYAAEKNTAARVDKLILLDVPGFEAKNSGWTTLIARTPILNRLFWKISPRYFVQLQLQSMYADDALVSDSLVQRHFELLLREGNRKAYTDRASVRDNRPPVEIIEDIKIPTLILWGAEDTQISPENAYEFHKKIRRADLKIYRNTGHWPQEEQPGPSVHDVMEFLEGRF